ncbi:hypothetical protein G7Z17_g3927 [Cylindrodendrum hubeiense]|uniref:Uncharacterized protein n=1 Tax=Cylindrodendrum hubeiense TaxID=595255 RepID=A0A9P5H9V7_9HYPO|nr:hypothetical protein G7Z17_g3927 [Cylindrodendrum hubeiense]
MSDIKQQIQQASTKNADLLQVLAQTDYAAPALQEQLRFISELEAQLATSEEQLKVIDAKRVAELADHVKYRDSHIRRFMSKATGQKEKFEAKAAKEEEEYYEALQQQHEISTVHNNMKKQLEDAEYTRGQLRQADALHRDTQRELDNLYDSIFAGETPHFPEEDKLEKQSELSLQLYHNTRLQHEAETNIISLLTKGVERVKFAGAQMVAARSASRYDLFGGGAICDALERSALSQADAAIREACVLAQCAHIDDLPKVNINQGHIIRDILFDSISTDLQFHQEIKRGQIEVEQFASAFEKRLATSQDRLKAVEGELREREAGLEEARYQLQAERQKVFELIPQGKQ